MADPNSKGVYFVSGRTTSTLILYRFASKKFTNLVEQEVSIPYFSPDSRLVAYLTSPSEPGKNDLWIVGLANDKRVKLASAAAGRFIETLGFSNDDKKFLYADSPVPSWTNPEYRLFVVGTDGLHQQRLNWDGEGVGWVIWEPGDQSMILSGLGKDKDQNDYIAKNWRYFLNGSPPVLLSENCGMAVDMSPDHKFLIGTLIWGDNPGIYQYSLVDKKCTS
jgi:hypothetical protein